MCLWIKWIAQLVEIRQNRLLVMLEQGFQTVKGQLSVYSRYEYGSLCRCRLHVRLRDGAMILEPM